MNYDREKIHAYIDNELSPEERRSFEAEVQEDQSLARWVTHLRTFKEVIRKKCKHYAQDDLLKECLEALYDRDSQERAERVVFRLRYAFAGVVLFVLILNGVLHRLSPHPEVNAPVLAQMLNTPAREQVHVSPGYYTSALEWVQDKLGTPLEFPRLQNPRLVVQAVEVVQCSYFKLARFFLTDGEMVCVLILIPRDTTVCGQPTVAKGDCYYYTAPLGEVNAVWWREENCVWILTARAPTERLLQMVSP